MRKDSKDLTEIFSVGSNDSDPSIGEIRKKIKHKKSAYVFFWNLTYALSKNKIIYKNYFL